MVTRRSNVGHRLHLDYLRSYIFHKTELSIDRGDDTSPPIVAAEEATLEHQIDQRQEK
jgi:hypothetical protein